jgi:hypothetical protein
MTIPSRLKQLIQEALESVHHHPQHDLNLGYRQAIWLALESEHDDIGIKNNLGYTRRALLAIFTVRHVLPIWCQAFPNDDTPQRILAMAEKVIHGKISKEIAELESDLVVKQIEQLGYNSDGMEFTVGYSAVAALNTAVSDENFDPEHIDYSISDNLDVEGNDASFFAAAAYSNGPIWKTQSNSDSAKRREFWEWWLMQAVPLAWESIREPKTTVVF